MFHFCLYYAVLAVPCSFVVTCWERAYLLALLCVMFLVFCHFPIWCLRSGVVLDCIESWSLPSIVTSFVLIYSVHMLAHAATFSSSWEVFDRMTYDCQDILLMSLIFCFCHNLIVCKKVIPVRMWHKGVYWYCHIWCLTLFQNQGNTYMLEPYLDII